MEKAKVLYVVCSPATGSTLLPFLLIEHPQVCSVSHTTGWPYPEGEAYYCSCGEIIDQCPFYRTIEQAFHDNGLDFEYRNFGTRYKVSSNNRLDRLLISSIPVMQNSALERLRDSVVWHMPGLSSRLKRQQKANLTFISTALSYHRANVFVDGSQDPFRLRHLSRIDEFDIQVLYLIRDLRGIALSRRERDDWGPAQATQVWIRDQMAIQRVISEFPGTKTVYYEDLCDFPDRLLEEIHRWLGLTPQPYSGSFMDGEHHIIGNAMRLRVGRIKKAERWKTELTSRDLDAIRDTANSFIARHPHQPVVSTLRHYLNDG